MYDSGGGGGGGKRVELPRKCFSQTRNIICEMHAFSFSCTLFRFFREIGSKLVVLIQSLHKLKVFCIAFLWNVAESYFLENVHICNTFLIFSNCWQKSLLSKNLLSFWKQLQKNFNKSFAKKTIFKLSLQFFTKCVKSLPPPFYGYVSNKMMWVKSIFVPFL